MRAVSTHSLLGLMERGLANPATSWPATKLRAGLHEVSSAVGTDVDVDSSTKFASLKLEGLTTEASKQGWGGGVAKRRGWWILNP